MTTSNESNNRRISSMWTEAGIQFRSNILKKGEVLPLHVHNYDHVSMVTQGHFKVKEVTKDGEIIEYIMSSKDYPAISIRYRIVIPAWHKHEFTLLSEVGEVLCMWVGKPDNESQEDRC